MTFCLQFNISVVTYSTADYRPTPILAKRYFNTPPNVSKELRDESAKLGIGATGNAGRFGMAALEGYAACLEVRRFLSVFVFLKLIRDRLSS